MSGEPVKVYTSPDFLDAEYNRIKGSWFWKTYVRHLENQMEKHMEITMAGASGAAVDSDARAGEARRRSEHARADDSRRGGRDHRGTGYRACAGGRVVGQ